MGIFTTLESKLVPCQAIAPAAARAAATVNGAAIDKRSVEAACGGGALEGIIVVDVGASSGSPSAISLTIKLQDSADNSSWADVTSNDIVDSAGDIVLTAESQIQTLGFRLPGLRRYLRVVGTLAFTGGTSPTLLYSASVLIGHPQRI